eukprot:c21683_g1_i1 orf=138-869(+)
MLCVAALAMEGAHMQSGQFTTPWISFKREKKKKKKKEEDHHACSDEEAAAPALKFYQARARDVLHKYLDKTFEIKPVNCEGMEAQSHFGEVASDTGFHLFRSAPSGLSEKRHRQEAVSRRERKLQNNHVDEDSLMFESSLLAAAVDGMAVKLHVENAKAKAFASWVLHQAEENEAKRKEEERVALLKAQRGEQWLPSVARDMQLGNSSGGNIPMKVGSVYTQNNAKSNAPDSQPHSSLNIEVK